MTAHAQKPDFVFRRNERVHLNRRGRQFSPLLVAQLSASAVVMVDTPCSEIVWRVLATHTIRHFPLYFPSRASPCVITFQLESAVRSKQGKNEYVFHFVVCEREISWVYPVRFRCSTPYHNFIYMFPSFCCSNNRWSRICTGSDRHIAGLRFSFRESALNVIKSFMSCTPRCSYVDHVREDELDCECSTQGREAISKSLRGFGWKTWRKDTAWRTQELMGEQY